MRPGLLPILFLNLIGPFAFAAPEIQLLNPIYETDCNRLLEPGWRALPPLDAPYSSVFPITLKGKQHLLFEIEKEFLLVEAIVGNPFTLSSSSTLNAPFAPPLSTGSFHRYFKGGGEFLLLEQKDQDYLHDKSVLYSLEDPTPEKRATLVPVFEGGKDFQLLDLDSMGERFLVYRHFPTPQLEVRSTRDPQRILSATPPSVLARWSHSERVFARFAFDEDSLVVLIRGGVKRTKGGAHYPVQLDWFSTDSLTHPGGTQRVDLVQNTLFEKNIALSLDRSKIVLGTGSSGVAVSPHSAQDTLPILRFPQPTLDLAEAIRQGLEARKQRALQAKPRLEHFGTETERDRFKELLSMEPSLHHLWKKKQPRLASALSFLKGKLLDAEVKHPDFETLYALYLSDEFWDSRAERIVESVEGRREAYLFESLSSIVVLDPRESRVIAAKLDPLLKRRNFGQLRTIQPSAAQFSEDQRSIWIEHQIQEYEPYEFHSTGWSVDVSHWTFEK